MKRNVIYGLAVTGCAMALTVSTGIGAVAAEDTIVIGNTSIIDTVDPVHNGSNAWSLTADGVSETVFMQDKDGNLVSRFVDSIEQKGDLTWEIKLKSGVKFSDGTDVDAQAFCDSMNSIMQNNEMASSSAGMITFTATDDATVTLTTERETTVMPSVLCEYNMVV